VSNPLFSDDQTRVLTSVLDTLVPPGSDGQPPGAGELGLVRVIEDVVRRSPELAPVVEQGLARIGELARDRGARDFTALDRDGRRELLEELGSRQPDFLPSLAFHTYCGYYAQDRVLEALGLEPRPPHPKGYELERGDLGLLDAVRRRPRLYRESP